MEDYFDISDEEVGNELKNYAQGILSRAKIVIAILAVCELVGAIAGSIPFFDYGDDIYGILLIAGAVLLIIFEAVVVINIVRLISLLVYARGEQYNILQTLKSNNRLEEKTHLGSHNKQKKFQSENQKPNANNYSKKTETIKIKDKGESIPIIVDDNYIRCPVCQTVQKRDRKRCFECGEHFVEISELNSEKLYSDNTELWVCRCGRAHPVSENACECGLSR